jgi:hypothetical protein
MDSKVITNIIQLKELLYKELEKKKLSVLAISYQVKTVQVLVFNNMVLGISMRKVFYKHFLKLGSFFRVYEKFGISKKIFLFCFKNIKIKKKKKKKFIFFFFLFFS